MINSCFADKHKLVMTFLSVALFLKIIGILPQGIRGLDGDARRSFRGLQISVSPRVYSRRKAKIFTHKSHSVA